LPTAALEAVFRVSVELPLPGEAMLAGEKLAVTPRGSPVTERETPVLKLFCPAVLRVAVVELPTTTLAEVALAEKAKLGGGSTVRLSVTVFVTPAALAVIVRFALPAAVEAAVKVSVLLPVPDAMLAGEKLAVTPLGNVLTDNATAEVKPFCPELVNVTEVVRPGTTLALVALSVKVNVGGGTTVSVKDWVLVTPPPVAVKVKPAAPVAAPEATVRVSVLLPLPGEAKLAGTNFEVTPRGSPLTERLTADLNPVCAAVLSATETLPDTRLALVGVAVSVNVGAGTVSVTVALWLTTPLIPVKVSV